MASVTSPTTAKTPCGTTTSGSVWASGALVKDRLFGYALLQYAETDRRRHLRQHLRHDQQHRCRRKSRPGWSSWTGTSATTTSLSSPRSPTRSSRKPTSIRMPLRPVDRQRWSGRRSANTGTRPGHSDPALTPATTDLPTDVSLDPHRLSGHSVNESGGESWSLKYTGYLTDNFTLSALYGHGESSRRNYGVVGQRHGCRVHRRRRRPGRRLPDHPAARSAPLQPSCSFIGLIGTKNAKRRA